MIVRIVGDTQYEFPDDQAEALNSLDNQVVEAGTLLVELDPRDYQVALDRSRATVHLGP